MLKGGDRKFTPYPSLASMTALTPDTSTVGGILLADVEDLEAKNDVRATHDR